MRRVQAGDAGAFDALYDRFGARAFRLATGLARDSSRAEDITQEAFLSVWRSRDSYSPDRGSVVAWVLGTVRNRAIDSLRHHRRHDDRRADDDAVEGRPSSAVGLDEAVGERDEAARLRAALAGLPVAQREVIVLAYFGELSTAEIARDLALPLGTVK